MTFTKMRTLLLAAMTSLAGCAAETETLEAPEQGDAVRVEVNDSASIRPALSETSCDANLCCTTTCDVKTGCTMKCVRKTTQTQSAYLLN